MNVMTVGEYHAKIEFDEELDLFINKKLLSLEFETEGFTSLKDAVNWARQNDFDVALIDYYLGPGIFANHKLLNRFSSVKPVGQDHRSRPTVPLTTIPEHSPAIRLQLGLHRSNQRFLRASFECLIYS